MASVVSWVSSSEAPKTSPETPARGVVRESGPRLLGADPPPLLPPSPPSAASRIAAAGATSRDDLLDKDQEEKKTRKKKSGHSKERSKERRKKKSSKRNTRSTVPTVTATLILTQTPCLGVSHEEDSMKKAKVCG
ncbi:AP-3 complex subunit delta-1 isoform X2 [Bubalus bubalis]|uniref:AP-3 complex subunit delta-1 isoform X2 n=1 Tax=Bubalus bubalis TaxID=89462 RepID=UPI001D1007FD|nr:AP-3 complex subunit delta-1 isoform X2 [Bubalus bubalis]